MALLLVPLLTPPASAARNVAGGLFASGICLFSGGLYGTVYTGDKKISQGAPFGGIAFILVSSIRCCHEQRVGSRMSHGLIFDDQSFIPLPPWHPGLARAGRLEAAHDDPVKPNSVCLMDGVACIKKE